MHCYTQCPQPCSRPLPTHTSAGDSWTLPGKSGSVSCGITVPFSWVLVHTRFCLCPPRVHFPVLCKFWQLYGGVNGGLLQEGLCHTQVCCTQSPCPRGSPLLTRTSTGDAQTQFCLSSCGVPGAWCTQGLFGPLSVVFILKAPQPTQAPDWLPVCDPACRTRTGSSEPSFPLETPHTCPVFSSVHTRSYLGKLFCF